MTRFLRFYARNNPEVADTRVLPVLAIFLTSLFLIQVVVFVLLTDEGRGIYVVSDC